jgi:hypothetical protein
VGRDRRPQRFADFWLEARDWQPSTKPKADDDIEILAPSDRDDVIRRLLFLRVPEAKQVKNRVLLTFPWAA